MDIESVQDCVSGSLVDARYALSQCRKWGDADRAGDALERIVERLERAVGELADSVPAHPAGWESVEGGASCG